MSNSSTTITITSRPTTMTTIHWRLICLFGRNIATFIMSVIIPILMGHCHSMCNYCYCWVSFIQVLYRLRKSDVIILYDGLWWPQLLCGWRTLLSYFLPNLASLPFLYNLESPQGKPFVQANNELYPTARTLHPAPALSWWSRRWTASARIRLPIRIFI